MDLYRGLRHRWGLVPDDSIPRLPEQPIFYPVLNEQYATQIARDRNVKDSGAGYVTRFHVRKEFVAKYPLQRVGDSVHQELWISAEDLLAFNENIVGEIQVIAEFHANNLAANAAATGKRAFHFI